MLLWAPVFGADVTLPTFPNAPDIPGQPGPSSSVSGTFNGAAAAGFRMEYKKWSLDSDVLWAGMSGTRETPLTKVGVDLVFGGLRGGYQVRKHLWVEAGFRRLAFNISAKIGSLPEVSRKPGVWDPLTSGSLTDARSVSRGQSNCSRTVAGSAQAPARISLAARKHNGASVVTLV